MTKIFEILTWGVDIPNPIPQALEAHGIDAPTALAFVVCVVVGVVAIVDSIMWKRREK